jgi:hypothetical protein
MLETNPTGAFEIADAGGQEQSRNAGLVVKNLCSSFRPCQ